MAPLKRLAPMNRTILTDGTGRPFARPEKPAAGAAIAEKIAYLRAVHAYNDRVADCANAAFTKAFSVAVKA